MKKLSSQLLADTVIQKRKALNMTQAELAKATGINRALLSRIESEDFIPSIEQLQNLGETLNFDPTDLFVEPVSPKSVNTKKYNIAVAGTGYVGLSLAVLLSQHNKVTAVDIVPEKVEKLNNYSSPIQDDYIELFLNEAKEGKRNLNLTATVNGDEAYKSQCIKEFTDD